MTDDDWTLQFHRALHHIERDASKPIEHLMPHYSNDYFKNARTVYLASDCETKEGEYGETVKGAAYNYSDRIRQWHTEDEYEAAWKTAKASGHQPRSAAYLEVYLRAILDNPELKLVHILAGVNWSNGYPYQVYGYIVQDEANS